jgi:hypothetical protein
MYALGALMIGIVLLYICMSSVEGFANKSPPLKSKSSTDLKNEKNVEVITIPLLMKSASDIKVIRHTDIAKMNGNVLTVTFGEKYKIHDFAVNGIDKNKKIFLGNFDFGKTTPTLHYNGADIRRDNIKNVLKNAKLQNKENKFPITPNQFTIKPIDPDTFGGITKLNSKENSNINIDFLVSSK